MDFVKIRGKDLPDCILQMKMQYGPDAHFYEHRYITEGGLFGTGLFANRICELDVGVPEKQVSRERIEKKLQDLKDLLKERQKVGGAQRSIDQLRSYSETKRTRLPISRLEPFPAALPELILEEETPPKPTLKSRIEVPPNLLELQTKLEELGMSESYSQKIANEVQTNSSPRDLEKMGTLLGKAVEVLENRIQCEPDLFSGRGRGQRKVVFFSGPTGSGKTTTIAKLAAKYALHMGKKVSLFTIDNYRIAAVDQLRFYAEAMDLEFQAPKDPRKFKEALLRDGSELVLVDTAGYSHRNPEQLGKVLEYFSSLGERDTLENILVLSATTSQSNAAAVMEAYLPLGGKRLILTKLDEAEYLGSFLELADTKAREFAFCTVGQDVPFDILSAQKKLLAEAVIFPEKLKGIAGEVFERTT